MKTFLVRLGAVTAIGILSLAIAESALRGLLGLHGSTELAVFAHDPLLGWKFEPGTTGWHGLLDFMVEYRINSKGLRDREYAYEKPRDTFRILVLGDSVAEGYGVAQDHTFSKQLETMVQQDDHRVEVINAGIRGYSTDQQTLFFEREGAKYHPDLTLLTFGLNEINTKNRFGMGARTYFKPYFVLNDEQLELRGVPVPLWSEPGRWIDPAARGLRPLVTYQLFRHYVARGRSRAAESREDAGTTASDWLSAWPVEKVLLRRLRSSVAVAGGTLAIVMNDLNAPASDRAKWAAFEEYCVSAHISCLRLHNTAQFRGAAAGWQLGYDPHWNERGHLLAARAIRDFLETSQILPPRGLGSHAARGGT